MVVVSFLWRDCTFSETLAWSQVRRVAGGLDFRERPEGMRYSDSEGSIFTDGTAICVGAEQTGYCETCADVRFACYIGVPACRECGHEKHAYPCSYRLPAPDADGKYRSAERPCACDTLA